MAQDRQDQDLMGYEALAQEALRGVIKSALKRAAAPGGLPGAHHFYITFRTRAPGVSVPPELIEKYPDEMTIVLQHQYWDLAPGETFFTVTLKFGGSPRKLSIPYAAITRFYDPSVQFLLQFEEAPESSAGQPLALSAKPDEQAEEEARETEEPEALKPEEPKIVSLDQFRKK